MYQKNLHNKWLCVGNRVPSLQRSGNTIKVHSLVSLSPNEKGTVEVEMGCRVVLRLVIFSSVSSHTCPTDLEKKTLQNLKRWRILNGENKATVRHNTILHRDSIIHKQVAELWKKAPNPSIINFLQQQKIRILTQLMEKGGGNKEFYCSQQVQLPERERR